MTMADQDEDISHLRAPDAADYDPTEEAQDFLKLDKLTYAFTYPHMPTHVWSHR
jgi:tRNA-splicing endonuclease subunit Sen54